jgi:RNA polymerase sigma-70 factor (ECF subfamily)
MSTADTFWAMAGELPDAHAARFERVLTEHERPILRLCFRLLGNLADAQDAAQEVFLRVYRHRAELADDRNPSPWLYQIAVNVCHDRRRKLRPVVDVDDVVLAADSSPERAAAMSEMQRHLMTGLETLPEKERQALVLRDLEELPAAEVARILGSTETTVRSQASMARAKLPTWFDKLQKKGGDRQ